MLGACPYEAPVGPRRGCEREPATVTGPVGYADHHVLERSGRAERSEESEGHVVPGPLMPFLFFSLCSASEASAEDRNVVPSGETHLYTLDPYAPLWPAKRVYVRVRFPWSVHL